jgi:hypothetical protein
VEVTRAANRPASTEDRGLWRELLWLAPLFATYSFVLLKIKLDLTPGWFGGLLVRNHARLLDFSYSNNEQSRLLQFYVPEALHRLFGLTIPDSYLLARFVFVLLAFLAMHLFCRAFFDRAGAALCVSVLAALTGLSLRYDLQESAPLLLLVFVICLWRIRERDDAGYLAAMIAGALVNETCLVLASVHFFYDAGPWAIDGTGLRRMLGAACRTFVWTMPAAVVVLFIRYLTWDNPHLGGSWHLPDNLAGLGGAVLSSPLQWVRNSYAHTWLLFGPLWIYAFVGWRRKPLFLRAASLMIPIFIAAHLLTGILDEVRQLVPLGVILVPMALWDFAGGRDPLEAVTADVAAYGPGSGGRS